MPGKKTYKPEIRQQPGRKGDMRKLSFMELQALRNQTAADPVQSKLPLSALCDDIRSLHNVGAIFRTADGAALQHLYLCGITGTPPRSEIRKTSLGAEETVAWTYHQDPAPLIHDLRKQGQSIVVLEQTDTSVDYRCADYHFPMTLIIGHEYNGVRDELLDLVDLAIEIPMLGSKHSLNVSVAFAVAAYEIRRQWEERSKK
jgi:tRNA G18 (ribose-2'-O)-methylase SpoU